jgi:hypothetical protein
MIISKILTKMKILTTITSTTTTNITITTLIIVLIPVEIINIAMKRLNSKKEGTK